MSDSWHTRFAQRDFHHVPVELHFNTYKTSIIITVSPLSPSQLFNSTLGPQISGDIVRISNASMRFRLRRPFECIHGIETLLYRRLIRRRRSYFARVGKNGGRRGMVSFDLIPRESYNSENRNSSDDWTGDDSACVGSSSIGLGRRCRRGNYGDGRIGWRLISAERQSEGDTDVVETVEVVGFVVLGDVLV